MKKTIKITVIVLISLALAATVWYFALFFSDLGKEKTIHELGKDMFDRTYMNEPGNNVRYVMELVDYEMLSLKYKSIVTVDEYMNADTDEKRLSIYKRFADANNDQRSESAGNLLVETTYGYDMSWGTDFVTVDDKNYRIEHTFDIMPDMFTFEPYISKWMIDITEV